MQPDSSSHCEPVDELQLRGHLNGCFHHYRYIVALLAGLAVGLMIFLGHNVTIAILQMVNQTHLYLEEHPNKTVEDFRAEGLAAGGEFAWNNAIVATILGCYMLSFTLPQVLVAKWNVLVGCRLAVPVGLSLCCTASLLTPAAAELGWRWVVACRLLDGLGAAGILPAMLSVLENWMRYDELSSGLTAATFVFTCMMAASPLIAGQLAAVHWSLAFHVPSYITLVFCLFWLLLVSDSPETNWLVSERELRHLEADQNCANSTSPNRVARLGGGHRKQSRNQIDAGKAVSWVRILKLPTFYAYLAVWVLNCVCNNGFLFILPAYLRQFLKIPIGENGFYCFLIQLGLLMAVAWPHQVLRLLMGKLNWSMTRARTFCHALCSLAMAFTFIYVGARHQNQLLMFFLNRCFLASDIIVTASIMSNFARAGVSSVAYAMINTMGNLPVALISPLMGRWLDFTGASERGWRMIFYGFGVAQLLMLTLFSLFISSEPIEFRERDRSSAQTSDQRASKAVASHRASK